jgi:hypothetical protein
MKQAGGFDCCDVRIEWHHWLVDAANAAVSAQK